MADLLAYTDGACSGNPGPGGWGALLVARDGDQVLRERELSGGERHTTNNRMELLAAIHALEALERPSRLTVVTDSAYVKGGITQWLRSWKRSGWLTSTRKPRQERGSVAPARRGAGAPRRDLDLGSRGMRGTRRTSGPTRSRARGWRPSSEGRGHACPRTPASGRL